jgi:hypothetical protein
MDRVYHDTRLGADDSALLVGVLGVVLLLALASTQVFVYRRTRRVFNPPLLAATGLALGFLVLLESGFTTEHHNLKVAKEDAFESIHLLYLARAAAHDGRGDEARGLLDRARRDAYDQAFKNRAAELATVDLARAPEGDLTNGYGYDGLFAGVLRNVTFRGEQEAAGAMVRAFRRYALAARRLRELEEAGRHDEAVRLYLGSRAGDEGEVFADFDRALAATVDINRRELDRVLAAGDRGLGRLELLDPLASLLVGVGAWIGVRRRLREYQA